MIAKLLALPVALGLMGLAATADSAPLGAAATTLKQDVDVIDSAASEQVHYRRYHHRHRHVYRAYGPVYGFYAPRRHWRRW